MKLSELKHNHSLTDLLKILLFAILMLAPIGMVATRCLYVIANKNAYQSYYGETINQVEENRVSQLSSLETGKKYKLVSYTSPEQINVGGNSNRINFTELKINSNTSNIDITTATSVGFYTGGYNIISYFYNNENTLLGSITSNTASYDIEFVYQSNNLLTNYNVIELTPCLYSLTYNPSSYLDNVFEYSVSQLEESNLFNWTENTAIFSGIQTMTRQLGITNQTIPILLTYWFLLTVIYVIIDIILKLFTYMTHALGNRKA